MSAESKSEHLISREPIYRGRIVDLSVDTVRFPDGSVGELEMVRHSGASAVVPVIAGEEGYDVVLVRQFRYAAGGDLLEIPAGRPDREGEPWEECARRELEEETGFVAGHLLHLGTIHTTPGFTDEAIRIFLATDLSEGSVSRDSDEFIQVERIPLRELLVLSGNGAITDAKTICGVHLAAAHLQLAMQ